MMVTTDQPRSSATGARTRTVYTLGQFCWTPLPSPGRGCTTRNVQDDSDLDLVVAAARVEGAKSAVKSSLPAEVALGPPQHLASRWLRR